MILLRLSYITKGVLQMCDCIKVLYTEIKYILDLRLGPGKRITWRKCSTSNFAGFVDG